MNDSTGHRIIPFDPSKSLMAKHLTKIELFAAMAMQGLLSNSTTKHPELICIASVNQAEDLLKELEKRKKDE